MKYLRTLSLLLIFLMNIDFSKEIDFYWNIKCGRKIKNYGIKVQSCLVKHGLKTLGKLISDGGQLLDIPMPGNVRECAKLLKQTSNQIGNLGKKCREKCKKNKINKK